MQHHSVGINELQMQYHSVGMNRSVEIKYHIFRAFRRNATPDSHY
jgi:hypothetical protein